ncbi:MAG: hypothetical protein Hyperionvirus2_110 [Hyperionvirus sp.]|uniref:Uncharacterized protein n=1 Tax=Hyperionvirus sp. TaxID=2487770 RepID=A0A3G5A6T1_9VIRU|nr:MAG: hypothetical protein Hyperionvirus2_110 [Hyperionvirus sp.]
MTKKYIEKAKLVGSNGENSSQGASISLSGDGETLAIGGPNDNNNYGAVWMFTKRHDRWIEEQKLIPVNVPITPLGVFIGFSVALSRDGKTLAISTLLVNAVIIYTKNKKNKWIQFKYILVVSIDGVFGSSVALSACGDLLAVGYPSDNGAMGAVWLFKKVKDDWFQIDKLVVTDAEGNPALGCSVSLSDNGDILAIGGKGDNATTGATWIFKKKNNRWVQKQKIVGSDSPPEQLQGFSVSLNGNGNILAVGGPGFSENRASAAWVFERKECSEWVQVGNKLIGQPLPAISNFGQSVSLSQSGKLLAIGAPGDLSESDEPNIGETFIFKRGNKNYIQYGEPLVGSDTENNQKQGNSVSLSSTGCTLAIGGPGGTSEDGATWIFGKL